MPWIHDSFSWAIIKVVTQETWSWSSFRGRSDHHGSQTNNVECNEKVNKRQTATLLHICSIHCSSRDQTTYSSCALTSSFHIVLRLVQLRQMNPRHIDVEHLRNAQGSPSSCIISFCPPGDIGHRNLISFRLYFIRDTLHIWLNFRCDYDRPGLYVMQKL